MTLYQLGAVWHRSAFFNAIVISVPGKTVVARCEHEHREWTTAIDCAYRMRRKEVWRHCYMINKHDPRCLCRRGGIVWRKGAKKPLPLTRRTT